MTISSFVNTGPTMGKAVQTLTLGQSTKHLFSSSIINLVLVRVYILEDIHIVTSSKFS